MNVAQPGLLSLAVAVLSQVPLPLAAPPETLARDESQAAQAVREVISEADDVWDEMFDAISGGASAEQRLALGDSIQERFEGFGMRLAEIADESPGGEAAFEAWAWVTVHSPGNEQLRWRAIEALTHDHVDNEALDQVGQVLSFGTMPATTDALRNWRSRTPHRCVRLNLTYQLAQQLARVAALARNMVLVDEETRNKYMDRFVFIESVDPEAFEQEAGSLFEEVLAEGSDCVLRMPKLPRSFAAISLPDQLLGEQAGADLRELRTLSVGMTAPEIEADDLSGVPFKLSDARGKIVVLSFSQFLSAYEISHGNSLVERFTDRPFAYHSILRFHGNIETPGEQLESDPIGWRSFWDGDGELSETWNAPSGVNRTWVLDARGVIRFKSLSMEQAERAVELLLAEGIPDVSTLEPPPVLAGKPPGAVVEVGALVSTEGGRPLENALVELFRSPTSPRRTKARFPALEERRTRMDGRCAFLLEPGAYALYATFESVGTSGFVEFEVVEGEAPPVVRLACKRQATIAGRVLAEDGRPLQGASVSVRLSGSEARWPKPVLSDAEGVFHIRTDPGSGNVIASIDGESTLVQSIYAMPGAVSRVELQFGRKYRVTGRVRDIHGTPLSCVVVRFSGHSFESVRTQEDGLFVQVFAGQGKWIVGASKDELVQQSLQTLALWDEQPEAQLEITLIPGGTIRGDVRWDDGQPLGRVMVTGSADHLLSGEVSEAAGQALTVRTRSDASGAFELTGIHPDYEYRITVYGGRDVKTRPEPVFASAGSEDVVVVFDRLAAEGFSLEGAVVDQATGHPVERYTLSYGMWIRGLKGGRPKTVQIHDSQGRFHLAKLGRFDRAFKIEAEGYPTRTVGPLDPSLERAEPLVIELGRWGGLNVSVVDADGNPVPDAELHLGHPISEESPDLFDLAWEGRLGPTGGGRWDELSPGRYMLQAASGEFLSDVSYARVESDQMTQATVVVSNETGVGTLSVLVRDAAGEPRVGADVTAKNMNEIGKTRGPGEALHSGRTDDLGRVTFRDVRPGNYWVWPQVEEAFLSPRWVPVTGGSSVTVEFDHE